jgi:hypothetical protein
MVKSHVDFSTEYGSRTSPGAEAQARRAFLDFGPSARVLVSLTGRGSNDSDGAMPVFLTSIGYSGLALPGTWLQPGSRLELQSPFPPVFRLACAIPCIYTLRRNLVSQDELASH